MNTYINKDFKIISNNIDTNVKINEEILNKINLQTKNIGLYFVNNEFIFKASLEQALAELRIVRDKELSKTDYLFLSDNSYLTTTAVKTELKAKRKLLRDATEGLSTVEDVLVKIKEIKNIG